MTSPTPSADVAGLADVPGVLCYVDNGDAYFTTAPLADQWGDDWDDAPYEHNAERPYALDGETLTLVKFEGGRLAEPYEQRSNSPWSVRDINGGATPWLSVDHGWFERRDADVDVQAGVDFTTFRRAVELAGGRVFVALPPAPSHQGEEG